MTRVGRRGLILGPVTIRDGAAAPVNTVAPAIPASAVIGTALNVTPGTWTGATTLTYQWQRNTGSWVDISGATNTSYTPVDADFGRALRVVETADGTVSANSNETGLTAEAPVQSLTELLTDGDMEAANTSAWTGVNATLSKQTTDPYDGTRVLRVVRTGSGASAQQSGISANDYFELGCAYRLDGSGGFVGIYAGGITLVTGGVAAWTYHKFVFRATASDSLALSNFGTNGTYTEFDAATCDRITLNAELVAPAANMRVTQLYTLPGSPVNGDTIWILPRVSDFSAGNYWLTWLRYTGSQWDINLYSVALHTRTSRIAATNIGATNGIRVNANGDSWSLFTTTDSGDNWTQRGSTITNATYNTATGVNVLHTSSVTAGQLQYAPAT